MSKSIYEETLTELEMWKSVNAYDIEQNEKIDEHIKLLKIAQKQEKLLELYKELSFVRQTMLIDTIADDQFQQASDKEENLTSQIKGLEK